MENVDIFIGIDVSKLTLDLIGINTSGKVIFDHQKVENSSGRISKLIKSIVKKFKGQNILFSFEDTGLYGMPLEMELSSLKLSYCKIPALEIHLSKGISRAKTDKADCLIISQYELSNQYKLKPSKLPEMFILRLKALHTQREKLLKSIRVFKSNAEIDKTMPKEIVNEIKKTNVSVLKNLEKNLKKIDTQMKELIQSNDQLQTQFNLLNTVPGIGPQTAIYLLIVTKGFTSFADARKLACFAGVAPFPYQSGTTIKGRNKVSHLADKKLKSLISIAALTAKKYDHELNEYFERKVAEGKNKMLVMNNIRNKLLARAFSVVKRQQPYVNTRAFAA